MEVKTQVTISQAQATEERVVELVESATLYVELLMDKIKQIYGMESELDKLSSEEKNRLSNRPEVLKFEGKMEKLFEL